MFVTCFHVETEGVSLTPIGTKRLCRMSRQGERSSIDDDERENYLDVAEVRRMTRHIVWFSSLFMLIAQTPL